MIPLKKRYENIKELIYKNGIHIDENLDEILEEIETYSDKHMILGVVIGASIVLACVGFYILMYKILK